MEKKNIWARAWWQLTNQVWEFCYSYDLWHNQESVEASVFFSAAQRDQKLPVRIWPLFHCLYVRSVLTYTPQSCFRTLEFDRVFLKSEVSFTFISSKFLIFFTLKMASLDCSCTASKSRGNTDMGGWIRIGAFPPIATFTFAASARYCHLYLTNTMDATVTFDWRRRKIQNPKTFLTTFETGVITPDRCNRQT